MNDRTENLKERLRRLVAERAAISSLRQVSRDTGIDVSALSRFLSGKRGGLGIDALDRLFRYLGLELRPIRKPQAKKGR